MKYPSIIALVFFLLLLSGCETVNTTLKDEHADSIFDTTFFVIIPQNQIIVSQYDHKIPQNNQFGFIGVFVEKFARTMEYRSMLNSIKPLSSKVADLDFQKVYINELKSRLLFTNPDHIILVEKPPQYAAEFDQLIKSAPTSSVVILEADYTLDINYSTFSVNTILSYWNKTQSNPLYKTRLSYLSKPISLDHSRKADERVIPLWVKNKQSHYRSSFKQGIEESASLVATSLTKRYEYEKLTNNEMYTFYDYLNQELITGKVIFTNVLKQKHILNQYGVYYSIATRDPSYEQLSDKIVDSLSEKARVFVYCPIGKCNLRIRPTLYIDGNKHKYVYSKGFFI